MGRLHSWMGNPGRWRTRKVQILKYSHPRGVSRRADLDTQSEVPPISGIDINWKLSRNAASKTPPQTEGIRMCFPGPERFLHTLNLETYCGQTSTLWARGLSAPLFPKKEVPLIAVLLWLPGDVAKCFKEVKVAGIIHSSLFPSMFLACPRGRWSQPDGQLEPSKEVKGGRRGPPSLVHTPRPLGG